MCDIDFYNAMEANIEIEARQAARYTAAYNNELNRLTKPKPTTVNNTVVKKTNEEDKLRNVIASQTKRIINLEKTMDNILVRLSELENKQEVIESRLFIYNDKGI